MSAVVFLGPTLDLATAQRHFSGTILPPARHGDFIRVALERPDAIGIIDGYFDHAPAVWHKEILWALARQIPVFGAASIGALRALELGPFGMVGVGEVFRAFEQGELESDDEVAVAHLPQERGFECVSEALVNIRATLGRATKEHVVSAQFRERAISVARALHYTERTWPALLSKGSQFADSGEIAAFVGWLPANRVDQKRLDAVDMLTAMTRLSSIGWRPDAPDFRFNSTNAWQAALLRLGLSPR